jgi:hypothetical protein
VFRLDSPNGTQSSVQISSIRFGLETVVFVPGDLNGDGIVNFGDLTPFVKALTDIPGYEVMFPGLDRTGLCDVSGDGTCNFGDLTPFVSLLTAEASGNAVPEPSAMPLSFLLMAALVGMNTAQLRVMRFHT